MQIRVRSLQGDEFVVQIQEDQLVSSLKASISEKPDGPPVERQKLVFKGRTMQDSTRLAEYHLEENSKVHLILQKDTQTAPVGNQQTSDPPTSLRPPGSPCPMDTSSSFQDDKTGPKTAGNTACHQAHHLASNRFGLLLRQRLAQHYSPDLVDKIIANLYHEIDSDIYASSLDDLERLAKQKLSISNE